MAKQELITSSSAERPDLDWCQVRETVQMLNIALAQIEHAMRVGDDSIKTLADLFTTMIGHVKSMGMAAKDIPDEEVKSFMQNKCDSVSSGVQTAIMAFQFYDKLSQRLNHACLSISSLGELIGDRKRLYDPYEWCGLQEKIKSKYTLESDKQMFQEILDGKSIEEVLNNAAQKNEKEDDIELF